MQIIKFYYTRLILILVLLSPSLVMFAQDPEPDPFKLTWKIILPVLLGLYEVIVRFIPTVNDLSWLSWIIKAISFLNDFLNRKKRK